jgi:hypothetical protein
VSSSSEPKNTNGHPQKILPAAMKRGAPPTPRQPREMKEEYYQNLTRSELQAIAKKQGIKANLKVDHAFLIFCLLNPHTFHTHHFFPDHSSECGHYYTTSIFG